ncbi:CGNR zinc finger domain-containing protein [Marinobacter sp. 71-i]|uniref:CGNR zinc finger domain-containing protein n=1 Tax=Marinobacter iranensis TaxID=2962607 RepID=A0ABT5YA57_9GAMM|nr:CGNR zinc finger domain-containing protein [Marinobacter iranensis]MDF0750477.1 CGNR zinc finger domain-containing protein [Marinobacter iranensis]
MDLLNTEAQKNGNVIDYWNSGDDVLKWLERCGAVLTSACKEVDLDELLAQGRALRTLARRLIVQRKEGEVGDVSGLNKYLGAYLTAPHLERDKEGNLVLIRTARGGATASLLGPVAEAVAQLLVERNFSLIKQCEHPDCILWFYDRTKAHKRRWCSMALCGNRYKAAQFRNRRSGGGTV